MQRGEKGSGRTRPAHRQRQTHLSHQKQYRGSAVADKGKGNSRVRYGVSYNRYVEDHLDCHMPHDSRSDQSTAQISGMCGNHHKPPDQQGEDQDQQAGTDKTCLFTDNGKYHVILRLRDKSQLLQAAPQTLSENAAASNGVQTLDGLKTHFIFIGVSPDGDTEFVIT